LLTSIIALSGCQVRTSAVVPIPASSVGSLTTELKPAWAESDEAEGVFVQVSASASYICGLRQDGTVQCRGDLGALAPDDDSTPLRQMDVSDAGTCGVGIDGDAACWGSRQPAPPGRFADISTGPLLACGVREDGAAVCWGTAAFTVRSAAAAWASVAVGTDHVCLLDAAGSVVCLGPGAPGPFTAPSGAFESVAVGESVAFAIRDDGRIESWGYGVEAPGAAAETPDQAFAGLEFEGLDDADGHPAQQIADRLQAATQALDGWRDPDLRHQLVTNIGLAGAPSGTYTQIAAGQYDACAIATDGATHCWGRCFHDMCEQPPPDLLQLDVGQSFACGVRDSGRVACWGRYGIPAEPRANGTLLLLM